MTAAPSLSTPAGGSRHPQPTPRAPHQAQRSHTAALVLTQCGFPKVSPMGPWGPWGQMVQNRFHSRVWETPGQTKSGSIFTAGPTRALNVLKCVPRVQEGYKAGSVSNGIPPQTRVFLQNSWELTRTQDSARVIRAQAAGHRDTSFLRCTRGAIALTFRIRDPDSSHGASLTPAPLETTRNQTST